ncbi:hypothetical protein [Crenobacter intestini]|uniref:Uncharacterized protein n=1 Tax=Crenobacter intestini TaxID=2563443 RepID=A0A4T0V146_9NEIS|nr:hypothetical protein [Crenobacter intestini]TIC85234.1 hypothetical protein E5K04_04350 [Crenobacter intestini]
MSDNPAGKCRFFDNTRFMKNRFRCVICCCNEQSLIVVKFIKHGISLVNASEMPRMADPACREGAGSAAGEFAGMMFA